MLKRSYIASLLLAFISIPLSSLAQTPAVTNGLNWLGSTQTIDGNWPGVATEEYVATATATDALFLLNPASSDYSQGLQWLEDRPESPTDLLARRIIALTRAGHTTTSEVAQLIALRDSSGGWGGENGYLYNLLDTAYALQALKAANTTDPTIINPALSYLTTAQNSDGGWGFSSGSASNVNFTAVVSATLQQFPQMSSIATAVNKATAYLLAHQNSDGGFGNSPSTVHETALAYNALVGNGQTQDAPLQSAVNYLAATQGDNGSWNDDPYATALALKALYLAENRPAPPPLPPAGGTITGTLVDALTNQRLAGVTVDLASNPLGSTTSDASGNFTLGDVQSGPQAVNFSLPGYKSATATAAVVVGSTVNLGNIPLLASYSTGTIAGTISDTAGKPLAGVAIAVSGAWSGSVVTGADGSFTIDYVTPGAVTITATKAGYESATGSGLVYARTTLSFSPRLDTTPSQVTTGTLVGRVIDSTWGVPIDHLPEETGVTVTLSGGIVVSPNPNDGGRFVIPNLAPGTYQVIVGMNGFASQTFRMVIAAGAVTDMGTICLKHSFAMTLTGTVKDAVTGAPIVGAEVTVSGTTLTGRTDFTGTYAIADIAYPAEIAVKAGASGYIGKTFAVRTSPWTQTMNIILTPRATTGGLTGSVVDAVTNLPLAGVTLTLDGNPAITTTTNSLGTFTLATVAKGPQQFTLAYDGYASRTLTTPIAAGALNNVGIIPLAVEPLAAAVQGMVSDAVVNQPFADVAVQASGNGTWSTATTADGRYRLEDVAPGTITLAATAPTSKPGYYGASFTGTLAPGGLLVYNPSLSTKPPTAVEVTVLTTQAVYRKSDNIGTTVTLCNTEGVDHAASLQVRVTDPSGAVAYATAQDLNLAAEATIYHSLSFVLPFGSPGGSYKIAALLYDANGMLLGVGSKSIGVATSQISITPLLPAVIAAGANAVSFKLVNTGTLPVTSGVLSVTLKDPEGQLLPVTTQAFSLGLSEEKIFGTTLTVPPLKFGTYTLVFTQSDETNAGTVTEVALANSVAVTPLFDNASHRIRQTASLSLTLSNTGRFDLSSSQGIAVTVAVPDAGYAETKTLALAPAGGAGSTLLYTFVLPETLTAGQHGTRITLTLPSGSTTTQTAQLTILESALTLAPIATAHTAGGSITPVFSNNGGVDTSVLYKLSLYDAKATLIAEKSNTETVIAGSSLNLGLAIPSGAVEGYYNLVVNYLDLKTGKEGIISNALAISGVKGTLAVQTGKETYLVTENITGLSTTTNTGTPLTEGNLHLQVTAGPGVQKTKTWTTQADFQTGVRSGVDTYGVNDWIIPDDDFEGTTIDSNKWSTSGTVSIQSGRLFIDTTPATVTSKATSKWMVEGDFDIQVDFMSNSNSPSTGAQLSVACNSNSWVNIGNYAATGYASQVVIDGIQQSYVPSVPSSTSAMSGKLRVTRVSNKIITYYWNGTTWVPAHNATDSVLANPCSVSLIIFRNSVYPGASAAFDNFKIISGLIKTENQTVDSVRLLPLNDNFDDGVLNDDRWFLYTSRSAENSGVLRLIVNPIPVPSGGPYTTTGIKSKYQFPNDYVATVKFNNYSTSALGLHNGEYILHAYMGTSVLSVTRHSKSANYGGEGVGGWSSINNIPIGSPPVAYSSATGLLRLVRTGTAIASEFWNATEWKTLHPRQGAPSDPTNFGIYVASVNAMPTIQSDTEYFFTNKGPYADTGTITFQHDSGANGTRWGEILQAKSLPTDTSIKFRTRTAETKAGLTASTWSNFLTASGSSVPSPAARWIEIESTLASTNTNVTPLLNDLTVTYETAPGQILWQTDVPATLAQGAVSELNSTIGTLGVTGKLYLQGTLTSSTGQDVATADYPFYVEQGNIQVHLAPDKKIYRPGETVTISGEVRNLSSVAATGLGLLVKDPVVTLYSETFDLPANGSHPYSFTTTAGNDGVYTLNASVTQNATTLVETADQYETASPVVTATLSAPETVGDDPFTLTVTLTNPGKVTAATSAQLTNDAGEVIASQDVILPAGETRMLQFLRQITTATTYTATFSGDLNQSLMKTVTYAAMPTDTIVNISAKIVTDKIAYNANDAVTLTATLTASTLQENLSALITVTDNQGRGVFSASAATSTVMPGQTTTIKKYWNAGTNPAGTYLVTLQIVDAAGTVIAKATCDLVIVSSTKPAVLLKGQLSLDQQSVLTGEPVTVSYSVTNIGNIDLADIALSIQTVHLVEEAVYNTITTPADLAMGATTTNSGVIATLGYSARDYLVILTATIDGVEETLAGTYFRVEGAPSAPALAAPANTADVATLTPALVVSNAADPNADRLTYQFEIYAESGLTTLVAGGMVAETTSSTQVFTSTPLTENQTYFWRVRAYDGRLYSPWMESAAFRVNTFDDPPTAPGISSPADGTAVAVLTPTLTITNAADPDSPELIYNFDLAHDRDFSSLVVTGSGITSGQDTTDWPVPVTLEENGWYYWRAQADDLLNAGPWSNSAHFQVNTANDPPSPPVIVAPVDGTVLASLATEVVVANSVDPDSTVLSYLFEADSSATFDSPNLARSGPVVEGQVATLWTLGGLLDNTRYFIRVKASDGLTESPWSPVVGIFVNTVNDPPTAPVLDNPSAGAGVNSATPTLAVRNATDLDGDPLTYSFEVYADAALTSLVAQSDALSETSPATAWTLPIALTENQTYFWRARASDGSLSSDWMPAAAFMVNVANDAPGAPQLAAPADGTTVATLTPLLAVVNALDPDSDTLTYDVEVYSNGVLSAAIGGVAEGAGTTSVALANALSDDSTFTWRVRAHDGDRYGAWMTMATFSTHILQDNIPATIDFAPETLNRHDRGQWVKVEIALPHGYRAADIDLASIRLEGVVPIASSRSAFKHGKHENELTVRFRRSEVVAVLPVGRQVPVHVTGKVGLTPFAGVDMIKVIDHADDDHGDDDHGDDDHGDDDHGDDDRKDDVNKDDDHKDDDRDENRGEHDNEKN